MTTMTDAVTEAAKRLTGEELSPARAYIVYRAMGHHRSIKFKNYPAIDAMREGDPAKFDELVRKTVGVMKHYRWSYQTFLMALRCHDPQRRLKNER